MKGRGGSGPSSVAKRIVGTEVGGGGADMVVGVVGEAVVVGGLGWREVNG